MDADFGNKTKSSKCCCLAKQYHNNESYNLGNSLQILPRVVVFKKCFKIRNSYKSTINIINRGLFKRHFVVTTDNADTEACLYPKELENEFLLPSESLQIDVLITPLTKLRINRRRHIFITSQHPSITFSVPIIVAAQSEDDNDISLPFCISFPPTTAENCSYYKMIAYNKSAQKLQFSIKCSLTQLTFHTKSYIIKTKDYAEILLKLYCKDLKVMANSLKFKFNTGQAYDVTFKHEPLQWSLYVDTLNINFDCVRFERRKTHEFLICNESNEDIVFKISFISPEETINNDFQDMLSATEQNSAKSSNHIVDYKHVRNVDKFSDKHFVFEPNCGTIHAKSSYSVKISFCPVMHKDFQPNETEFSPFTIFAGVAISCKNEINTELRNIFLRGQIIGPDIEILPKVLNVQQVNFGEQQFAEVIVQNMDDLCDAFVSLSEVSELLDARIMVTPKNGFTLRPKQRNTFHVQFYITTIGRFSINLEFKVKNGGKHSLKIMGYSKPIRIKCFPEIVNLGVIPIAMPQKRFVLLMNPLTIPITVQCCVTEDGCETPLVLNLHNTNYHLPITVKDPLNYLQQSNEYNQENCHEYTEDEEEFELIYDKDEEKEHSILSERSQSDDNTSCSTEFARSALDLIPDMSSHLVSCLKTMNIFDKAEVEKKVVDEAVNVLLKTPYFCKMDKYKNYAQMDWNSLATDPQEIYCNTEIIYLKPKTGKFISILVIPNVLGYHVKYIELRICPLVQTTSIPESNEDTGIDFSQIVETDFMSTKLRIAYDCLVPEIIWNNIVTMKDQVYAGEVYDFQMEFRNNSNFGGFFYYDVVPQSSNGTMKFSNKKWKYFIESDSKILVPCQVKFTKLGAIKLYGCIKFVGIFTSYPFHIKAEVLPPRVNIFPATICKTVSVLELTTFHIFIENATPTSTWFKLKLKDESCMSFEPCGGQLDPNGQATYLTLNVRIQDPGIYKNILYVILEFETLEKIPITINVKGIPIFCQPEIRGKVVDVGHILCNSGVSNNDDEQHFSKVITVINKGLQSYRLNITRTKSYSKSCSCTVSSMKAKTCIEPNHLIIPGQSETTFSILLSSSEATLFSSEFRIQLTELNNGRHMENYRFTVKAEFIMPELSWNKREIAMNYQRTHKLEEPEQCKIIKLTNNIEIDVEDVKLKMCGPFKIKELFEHKYENELSFSMKGLETKKLFIMLNKEVFNRRSNGFFEGSIMCSANFRVQEDDVKQVASIVLSDILHMLEFEIIDSELDLETNMTWRYQKAKCHLKELNDTINAKEIVYEIVKNLDLNAKRYKLSYRASVPIAQYCDNVTKLNEYSVAHKISQETNFEETKKLCSSPNVQPNPIKDVKACISHTLDDILHHLKLEDSFEMFSMPSSESCVPQNSVHFFEKCGLLQANQRVMCALHTPPIRKGNQVRAVFQLDVVGGEAQQLEIVLVNLEKPLTITKQTIYLGLKPWYEQYCTASGIQNSTNYQLTLKLHIIHKNSKPTMPKIATGFTNFVGTETVQLPPFKNTIIKTEGIMGFTEYFQSKINMIVNESKEYDLQIYGHGAMPMLTMAKPSLALRDQPLDEIHEEYQLLQKVYYYEIFKTITEREEKDVFNAMPEEENDLRASKNLWTDRSDASDSILTINEERGFLQQIRTYIFVSQNEDLPNFKVLDQLLETEKFLNRLRYKPGTSTLLSALYRDYLLHFKDSNEQVLRNFKHFNVHSLPFHLKTHIVDMGKVYINQFCKLTITLDFYGPGKLIAAARTAVQIPGLIIDFQALEKIENKNFCYYRNECLYKSCNELYRNIDERYLDKEKNPKVRHAHSYDYNAQQHHQRIIILKDNKCVKKYYNGLNKSMYLESRNNFTHCKIAGINKCLNATKINVTLLFRPQKTYFEHHQNVKDYLFIDLHMGTTLPILLQALVVDPNR